MRVVERVLRGRDGEPSAVIFDGRALQSSPESGSRAGYDGANRKNGSKVHIAVDTLGNLLALMVTPANEQEREQVGQLAEKIAELTEGRVKLAYVDQGASSGVVVVEGIACAEATRYEMKPVEQAFADLGKRREQIEQRMRQD